MLTRNSGSVSAASAATSRSANTCCTRCQNFSTHALLMPRLERQASLAASVTPGPAYGGDPQSSGTGWKATGAAGSALAPVAENEGEAMLGDRARGTSEEAATETAAPGTAGGEAGCAIGGRLGGGSGDFCTEVCRHPRS